MIKTTVVTLFLALICAVQAQTTITFRQFDPPGEITALTEAVDAWNAEHDDIQIQLESIATNDALNTYVREAQAGGGPDIVHMGLAWVPSLTASDLLLAPANYMEDLGIGQGVDDFLATDLTTVDEELYAVPWTVDTFAMAYRPDALEAAGLDSFPETWDAFLTAAESLNRDTSGNGRTDQFAFCFSGGAGLNSSIWFISNYYLWSNGGSLVSSVDGTWQVGATVEQLADAMTYFNTFFENGYTPRALIAASTFSDPELTNGLAQGDCAVAFFPPQTFRGANETADTALMTAPIPEGSEMQISHLGGRALGVNPNTDNPEAAFQVVAYLTSAEVMSQLPQYPAQTSLLDELSFPDSEAGFVEMLPKAVTFKRYTDSPVPLPGLAEVTTREYASVFSGQKTPEQAAQDLINEINTLLGE